MSSLEPLVVVYQATNRSNGKRYVGVTKRGLTDRRRRHGYSAAKGVGIFQRAIRKYGIDGFDFEVLADFQGDFDLARAYEWEMIAKHRPEYNLTAGGEGGTPHALARARMSAAQKGRKHSPETRAKLSEAQRNRPPMSEATKEKIRQTRIGKTMPFEQRARMRGRKDTEETRAKKSAAQMGRPPTKGRTGQPVPQETREKIRQSLKQAKWVDTPARIASRARTGASAASEARKIPVRCIDDGNVFESVKAAAKFYGHDAVHLARAIRVGRIYRGRRFERLPKPT